MSAAERLASLDAALAAAAAEGASTHASPPVHGADIDWETAFEADTSVWLTRSLSVRQLRALLQQHSSGAPTPTGTPLVLLSLAELRLAVLPLVRSLLWGPAHQAALSWGRDALQELCCELGLPHEGAVQEDLARQVACSYFGQRFELPDGAMPPGCLGAAPPGGSPGGRNAGAQQAGQGAQWAQHAGAASVRGRGGAARRWVPPVARPPGEDDWEGVPEGVELSGRLEVQREVVSDGPEELEFKWVGATVEARLERPPDSVAPQRFLLRYDADPEQPLGVIERAVVSFIDQDELEDVNEGVLRWRLAGDQGSGASSPRSGAGSELGDATSDYLDARIGGAYAGPADEAFRRDTLLKVAHDLLHDDGSYSYFDSRRRWERLLDGLLLHHKTPPEAAAARGAALLAGSAGGPPSRRELAALAAWLGRDREGLRASGTSPAAAVEEEFGQRWEELQGRKQRAAEEATAVALVALGDVGRLRALCGDAGRDFTAADGAGQTPLHFAARLSRVECLKVLIEAARQRGGAQAFLESKDRRGRTALHHAVVGADAGTIRELLQAGASCAAQDREGRTPLHLAVEAADAYRQLWRVQLLLAEGGNLPVDALDRDGMSPLHHAIEAREEECIEALLDGGANVNLRGPQGETPLHLAAVAGEREPVLLLLDRGADAGLRNDDGMTPAELAADYRYDELEELLAQTALLKRLQSGGSRGPRRLLSSLSSRNMPSAEPDLDADEACVVCMRHRREVILAPCGHRHLCKGCTRAILTGPRSRRSCPMCKETIASFVSQVFE